MIRIEDNLTDEQRECLRKLGPIVGIKISQDGFAMQDEPGGEYIFYKNTKDYFIRKKE